MQIVTLTDSPTQPPRSPRREEAKALIDAAALPVLARTILRLRTRNPRALLSDVGPAEQERLREAAAVALLSYDDAQHRPALYLAADGIRDLGELVPTARLELVAVLDICLRTYRRVLAGDRPQERRQMALLATADLNGGGR